MKKKTKKPRKPLVSKLQKLSKKLKLDEDTVKEIVMVEHENNNFVEKFETVSLWLDLETTDRLRLIAKELKVSLDAVIVGICLKKAKQVISEKANRD